MSWNIAPECVSVVILGIIWMYSRRGSVLPTLRDQLFQVCFLVTFCAMTSNILSTVMIMHYETVPLLLTWLVTMIYYLLTPMMGMIYFLYSTSVIYGDQKNLKKIISFGSIPGLVYIFLVLVNPFFKELFDINRLEGYTQGNLVAATYIIFYVYCAMSVFVVLINRKLVSPQIYRILVSFPLIAVIVIIFQQFFPSVILSGSAATSALLIIYLHLQNKQISMDYLTNVPNRFVMLNMMELMLKRPGTQNFAVLVVSLRNFRDINTSYGQSTGDLFLKKVCDYLCTFVPRDNVYRFSGDEFAILLKGGKVENLNELSEEIALRMERPWQVNDYQCVIPAAMGIAYYPSSAQTLEEIINALEYAVFRAKSGKSGNICYCDQQMISELRRKNQIIQILKELLHTGDFELYYQPIVSLDSGRFLYAESLMRIPNSPIGPIYPNEFIPIAEETGLIIELTYLILEKVCWFVNKMLAAGIPIKAVHVNFSAVQFNDQALVQKVLHIIETNHTPFSAIKIEFTESAIAENAQTVTAFACEMKKRGILMGLDDFGTGYSNIATVIGIPFNTMKLDKSLINSAMESEKSATVVKNLTRTFKDLNMTVIAEGVENEAQNAMVKDCGIDQVQGYFYSKPMPEPEVEVFLTEHASLIKKRA